ncbi:MAG: RNA polymerase factor sigma-54, partial [Halochromatium sp.]
MKQSIQLRLGQQLTMTPQLQQAIKLLQLSTLDLQREIQDALESNLMLETAEEGEAERDGAPAASNEERDRDRQRQEADAAVDAEVPAESNALPDDLPLDSDWSDIYEADSGEQYAGPSASAGASSNASNEVDLFAQQSRPQTLHDHLEWQLNLGHLGARDQVIAEALIDAIDADGYLRLDPAELLETLTLEDLELDEVEAVLHAIQALDPPGIGARDPRECLLLQLRQLPAETPHRREVLDQIVQ